MDNNLHQYNSILKFPNIEVTLGSATATATRIVSLTATGITATSIVVTGNITASAFIGDGSQLTGIAVTVVSAFTNLTGASFNANTISASGNVHLASVTAAAINITSTASFRSAVNITGEMNCTGNVTIGNKRGAEVFNCYSTSTVFPLFGRGVTAHTAPYASYDTQAWSTIHLENSEDGSAGSNAMIFAVGETGTPASNQTQGVIWFLNRDSTGAAGKRMCGIHGEFDGGSTVGRVVFFTNDGASFAERMRINSTALGLFTTSPSTPFHVVGNSTLAGTLNTNAATAGNITVTAGAGLTISSGTNASHGLVTLVAGVATAATTKVAANTSIFLTTQSTGGTIGFVYVDGVTAGSKIGIRSSNSLDTSVVAWLLVDR